MARDHHVAGSVARECQPMNLFAVRTAQERRPLESGIDHERQRVSPMWNLESISLGVDLAKAALETAGRSVRQFFPGHRRGLTKRSGGSLENQSPVDGNLYSRHADRADDDLLEVGVRAQEHVVGQSIIPLQDAEIDTVVEPAIPHAAERGNIRLPLSPVVAEKEVVDTATLLLADDGRRRRSL